jgi:hypothetical protein
VNHVAYPGPPMYVLTLSAGFKMPLTQQQWDGLGLMTQNQLLGQGRVQVTQTPTEEYRR